jgi:hypothetical protein
MVAALLLAAGLARADSIRILYEKVDGKKSRVVVLRQVWDMDHGFDSYFLETFELPSGKKTSSRQLGTEGRDRYRAFGQYELYMRQVAKDRGKQAQRLEKKGYAAACPVAAFDTPGNQQVVLWTPGPGAAALLLRVDETSAPGFLVLAHRDRAFRLLKFKPAPGAGKGKDRGEHSVRRDIMGAWLVARGEHVAVVVRRQHFPGSDGPVDDDLYFLPLKKGLTALGLPFPLASPPTPSDGK